MSTSIVTSSMLSKFRECARRCFFEYIEKRVPNKEAGALSFGSAWHCGIETGLRNPADFKTAAATAMKEKADRLGADVSAMLCAMLASYNPPRSERFEVVEVEKEFIVPIEHPDEGKRAFRGYRLAGKIDVVLRHKETGATWIEDHKTTSSDILGFSNYWQALQVDSQMGNYCLAFDAAGFVYDVARKPSIKMCDKDTKAAAELGVTPEDAFAMRCRAAIESEPDAYFQWREHIKTNEDQHQARLDLWQHVEMYHSCAKVGRFPRNSNSCNGKFGTCPYIGVCTGRARLDDDAEFRSKAAANEELIT